MNPPFHQGRAAEPGIGSKLIAVAAKALKSRGSLYLVANKGLPYERDLAGLFSEHRQMASDKAFNIFAALQVSLSARSRPAARYRRACVDAVLDPQRRRPAEQEALHGLAAGGPQHRRLVLRLDALGDRVDAERPRQADDRRDDGARAGVGIDAADEGAVDLQLLEREVDEVAEVGIAGAEIVDGDRDAHVGKLLQDHRRALAVLHHRRFGDFEFQPLAA